MLVWMDVLTLENTVIFHHNGRYQLLSLETKKLVTGEGSFTAKGIATYLSDELEADDDPALLIEIEKAIERSRKHGHSHDHKLSAEKVFSGNKCLKSDKEMSFKLFIARHFQKGAKGLYRCEKCDQVIRIDLKDESFIDHGGLNPVSYYCLDCCFYDE